MTDDQSQTDSNQNPAQDELLRLQTELSAMTETAKRAMADLQNFKRRTEEERGEIQIFANMRFLEALFPALDNFARAFGSIPAELAENDWVKGVQSIESNLLRALTDLGLEAIDQVDVAADPHRHEILMKGDGPVGQVIQIFAKGYAFKGKTIRPAKVQVGKGE